MNDKQEEQLEPKAQAEDYKKAIYKHFGQFSLLEIVGMLAIAVFLLNQFFAVSITVTRKPLLQKLLGEKINVQNPQNHPAQSADQALVGEVLPAQGVELPAVWGDLGRWMIQTGVIDEKKFVAFYAQQGGLALGMRQMLSGSGNGKIEIIMENSGTILNMLWALGLGNKNEILEKGEMQDPRYGGADKFASTGGWPLAAGNVMDHYSKHQFIHLTTEQQAMVDRVSKNIYRACCGNSTHFPDCNHGMAMLGLLELMASQGVQEPDMYQAALAVNSYWFPNNYLTIASYFKKQKIDWNQVNPQVVLSAQYSSAQGYQKLLNKITPQQAPQSQGGCGV